MLDLGLEMAESAGLLGSALLGGLAVCVAGHGVVHRLHFPAQDVAHVLLRQVLVQLLMYIVDFYIIFHFKEAQLVVRLIADSQRRSSSSLQLVALRCFLAQSACLPAVFLHKGGFLCYGICLHGKGRL